MDNPRRPKLITATTIDTIIDPSGNKNYRVSLNPTSSALRYLALTPDGVENTKSVLVDQGSHLMDNNNRADYLIITPAELETTAEELAGYRMSQGLKSFVVTVEDIVDEFNYGIYNPKAIKDFLAYAYYHWKTHPRYAVLVGDGTWDYKNNMGYGDNMLPPIMVATPDGLSPSDNYYADVNGDHIPEIAIGRLPVVTNEELASLIDKIKTYESNKSDKWTKTVLMLADKPEKGGLFPQDSDSVSSILPSEYNVTKIYLSEYSPAQAKQLIVKSPGLFVADRFQPVKFIFPACFIKDKKVTLFYFEK